MRFLSRSTFCLLIGIQQTYGDSLRRVSRTSDVPERKLMPAHTMFHPLSCNESVDPCENWSAQGFDPEAGIVVIPCGKCITMDVSDDYLVLPNGLNIEGKLSFPDGYRITIEVPYIVVQGELEMISTRKTSDQEDIRIVMTNTNEQEGDTWFAPHPENSCDGDANGNCNFGTRPIVVAGGILSIKGLPEDCPSWAKLKTIVASGPSIDASEIPAYTPPAASCTNELVESDFEGNAGISWPSGWFRNYGGVDSYETENAATPGSTYALFGGRTSSWNGPQTNFDASCILPGATYFIYAKARLTKSGGSLSNCHQYGTNCLKITLYTKDTDTGKRWSNKGHAGQQNDGEWFDFVSSITFDDKTADVATAIDRRLYWEGPEAGVEIALDDIRIFRLPETSFPPLGILPSEYCSELIPNGDAEDTSLLPFTYPAKAKNGMLSVESEFIDGDPGNVNHFYALRNRDVAWASPQYNLPVGCIEKGSVYTFGLDIRMHSSTKEGFRLQMDVRFEDRPTEYTWLGICPEQDSSDGWVRCTVDYQFPEYQSTPTKIEVYLVQMNTDDTHKDGNFLTDADFDNVSASFVSGSAVSLVLPDPDGSLAACWGVGSEILVTSNNLDFDDVETPSIKSITSNEDSTVTLELNEPIEMTSHEDSDDVFAVEVALLSRNIAFSGDSDEYSEGAHLIIYHTNRPQQLDGVSFQKFGQQGNLGRYPVHFHMCGSAAGSLVSRNIVRQSFQRCYIVHGTHDVVFDSNVCYDHFGHGFLLEDFSERNNVLRNNLVAVTKKVITKIRAEETDDFPASYWITNPENTFIGNVAAGSEHSGFWFEMSTKVRGPSAKLHENNNYNPREQALKVFEDNVAHSNDQHGIKTYPGNGYFPTGEAAIFKNCLSYRNAGDGIFIHNSGNIKIEGGLFADNRVQVDIDRAPACSVDGAQIIGYSNQFRYIKETTKSRGHCPSSWPIRGIEIHSFFVGGSENSGTSITNTIFDDFGNTGCPDSVAILVDEENEGYFDVRNEVANVTFGAGSNPLSNCATSYSGVDNFVLRDDGSIMDQPGYIVSDSPMMTTFANCESDLNSCTSHCPGACLRAYVLSVSTLEAEDPSIELKITENSSDKVITIQSSYQIPLNADGSMNIAEHTKTHRNNLFYAVLPSSGDYSARFTKGGEDHWPLFVRPDYDDPDSPCPDFDSFTIVEPDFEYDVTCQELIRNGNIDLGIEGWLATNGGLETSDESASGQGLALTSMYRTSSWMGPAQYFDTRCLVIGARYTVSFKVKLVAASDGSSIPCDPSSDLCPKLIGKIESGAHQEREAQWTRLAHFPVDGIWVADDWNVITGTMVVDEDVASAGSTEAYFECKTVYAPDLNGQTSEVLMVIDDVSIQLEYWPSSS